MDLERVKKHLVVSHTDDDSYIKSLCLAAESHFQTYTNRTLLPENSECTKYGQVPMTPDIEHGLLMMIGHWYEHREAVTDLNLKAAPAATYNLWNPYCIYHLGDTACEK